MNAGVRNAAEGHETLREESGSPAIILDRVSLTFGDRLLFHDLSLHLTEGRTTCVLGPSGCGKSTLLKLIAGSSQLPYSGSICFRPQGTKQEVAWISQNDLLLPWLSLLDNVLLGARLRREVTTEKRERARSLLSAAGLGDYEKALPGTLSGGMRQRGALLRTLMEERQVVLMDEPFSALDALTRMRLQDLAVRMLGGKTVVLVTHDPLEALRLADRIIVLAGSPIQVAAELQLEGRPPRHPGSPEFAGQHADLLAMLLNGD